MSHPVRKDSGLQQVVERDEDSNTDLAEILSGLSEAQKRLSPKFFYDERGSEIFDEITRLPEYYPTTTERGIMVACVAEIADLVGVEASIIEFGAGSSAKIRQLLSSIHEPAVYVPVDISRDFLVAAAEDLAADFPDLEILPVAADFTQPFDLPSPKIMPRRNIVFFPGSTIGNFEPAAALSLLQVMYQEAGANGGLLIGVDLQKEPSVLERAYDDEAGVTAEFNLNMLRHINRAFDADFDLERFEHVSLYNADVGRIEMYLRSVGEQVVNVSGRAFSFADGERILTEHSYKYTVDGFTALAAKAGFSAERVWTDARQYFAVMYLTRD